MTNVVYLGITSKCNFNCRHCYLTPEQKNIDMPLERVLRLLEEFSSEDVLKIIYTHGEVFLHKNWEQILQAASQLGFIQNILTNGLLITKDICTKINDCDIKKVILSLDSANPQKHSENRNNPKAFDGLKRGVEFLKEYTNTQIALNSVLSSWTADELIQMYDLALSWNVPELRFLPYHTQSAYIKGDDYLYLLEKYIELLDYARGKTCSISIHDPLFSAKLRQRGIDTPQDICSAGKDYLSIHSNGEVFPCNFLEKSLGNIYKEDLCDIAKEAISFRKKLEQLWTSCQTCGLYSSCHGGCAAFMYKNKDSRCLIK